MRLFQRFTNVWLVSTILMFTVGCSHMRSGHYVYVEGPSQVQKVSKTYGVSVDDLRRANPDKSMKGGEWIFIPTQVGIMSFLRETDAIEDYSDLGTGRFMWPVPRFTKVSSTFGSRWGRHHDGIDIPAPRGTPIVASDGGVVIYSDNGIRGYGNMIVVAHEGEIFTVYAHNNKNLVDKGDRVRKGQVIGHVGNTGRSTGAHLHFEIRVKNKARNPANYLSIKN
jgi:murein DD-endopeptidase MepM/ murein hydrolase activator NlpD